MFDLANTMQTIIIRKIMASHTSEDLILTVPKTYQVADLQSTIHKSWGITPPTQKLYFAGKQMVPDHSLCDYKVNNNDVIQLMETTITNPSMCSNEESETPIAHTVSAYYQVGDRVDVMYKEIGAWFEAKILHICVKSIDGTKNESDIIFQVVMDRNEKTAPLHVKFKDIRPRAFLTYDKHELQPGMVVFVNYNIKKPNERGYWYDLKITNFENDQLEGIVLLGGDHENINNCKIKFVDEVMKIERSQLLSSRMEDGAANIPLRKLPLYCSDCKDKSAKKCKECSCCVCGKKNYTDKLIICDECECTYHLFCLEPPLDNVPPDPEWYCPSCKTDQNEIVRAGEKLKTISRRPCYIQNHFGCVFDVDVGTCWMDRKDLLEFHGSEFNIHGDEVQGVYSMILDSNNLHIDNGTEFYYLVCDEKNECQRKTIDIMCHQLFNSMKINRMLSLNCDAKHTAFGKAIKWTNSKPIRVIRSHNLTSKFAPKCGYRYDGIYKLVEYFPEINSQGFIEWHFLLRRDDLTSPPWTVQTNCSELFQIDARVQEFMDKDLANETLWQECKQFALQEGKNRFRAKVQELFKCVICQDVVRMPLTTICKHNFCYECLRRFIATKNYRCPSCTLHLGVNYQIEVNRNLEAALKRIFPGMYC